MRLFADYSYSEEVRFKRVREQLTEDERIRQVAGNNERKVN